MCESFFATLDCELIDRRRFRTKAEARLAIFSFIEGFYNPLRRHSGLGYLSPIDYERRFVQQADDPGTEQPAGRDERGATAGREITTTQQEDSMTPTTLH
jgi:hypothetical protein